MNRKCLNQSPPIRNRLPHEGKSNLREFLGKTQQTEGVLPAHVPAFLLEEERFKVALQKAVIGANLGEGDFPPATKTAHCFGSDPKKFRRFFDREYHMEGISRDLVFYRKRTLSPFPRFPDNLLAWLKPQERKSLSKTKSQTAVGDGASRREGGDCVDSKCPETFLLQLRRRREGLYLDKSAG